MPFFHLQARTGHFAEPVRTKEGCLEKKGTSGNVNSALMDDEPVSRVTKEGCLEKKGTSGLMRWQRRFFSLSGDTLSYSDSDGPGKPAKSLSLAFATVAIVDESRPEEFVLSVLAVGEAKDILLRSQNGPADAAAWIAAIEATPGTAAESKPIPSRE